MASSLPSLDFAGSSVNSGSSVTKLMQIGEAYGQRIGVRELLVQLDGDVFGVVPGQRGHQIFVPFNAPRTAVFIMFSASFIVA